VRYRIAFLAVLLFALAGCCTPGANGEETGGGCFIVHMLDWLFATSPTGTAPFQLLGMGLNVLIPGAGSVLATAAAGWQTYRKVQWKNAFHATAQVIENGAELGMSAEDLKPHLADAHAIANVDHLVRPLVDKIVADPVPTPTV
jgi:hypothetical protein